MAAAGLRLWASDCWSRVVAGVGLVDGDELTAAGFSLVMRPLSLTNFDDRE